MRVEPHLDREPASSFGEAPEAGPSDRPSMRVHRVGPRPGSNFLLLLLLLFLIAPAAHADRGGYLIEDFHTEIVVQENSDLVVTERLLVQFSSPVTGSIA
jgi:hypothetical protein